ncbi:MAG: ribonuclease Y [Planctomycetes bacterium]|nr:ribonuclease Y [Planctomycetota bacterium]
MEYVIGIFIGLVVGAAVVGGVLMSVMKTKVAAATKSSQEDAERLKEEAKKEAENILTAARLDAKNEALKHREKIEQELDKDRKEVKELEKRMAKREESIEQKFEMLDKKADQIEKREAEVAKQQEHVDQLQQDREVLLEEVRGKLSEVAEMTPEEAQRELLERMDAALVTEKAERVKKMIESIEETVDEKAKWTVSQAICRLASEHTGETTTSTVEIPSDEVKGRIIGREGRNIRHFERVTGVDVIVDDTPGLVVVSCFDSTRREIARRTLEKLIQDGRIHPARIEEIHELCTQEVDKEIIEAGKQIQFDADVHNVHPKAQRLLGRLKWRSSYGQNNYKHSVEVAHLCGMMAAELGLDVKLARRCGLMHDIGKAIDHEKEGGHPLVGKEFLISIGERPEVIEAAGGHHDQPMHHKYPYVSLAAAADAISASRPGARRESMERYVQRLTALEAVAKSFDGVSEAFAMQAGRELRVLVNSKKVTDEEALLICRQMAEKIEDELTYPGEIRVTLMRETRVTEYAR